VLCGVAGYFGSALARGTTAASGAVVAPVAEPPREAAPRALAAGKTGRQLVPVGPAQGFRPAAPASAEAEQAAPPTAAAQRSPDELLLEELQAEERDVARGVRMRQELERAFEADPPDAEWARSTEASFRASSAAAFSDPKATQMSTIECRGTLCKATFTHANDVAFDDFRGSERYLDLIEPFPQTFYQRVPADGGNPASTVVFLSREPGGMTAQLSPTDEPTEKP
jgi:hypothetical protein